MEVVNNQAQEPTACNTCAILATEQAEAKAELETTKAKLEATEAELEATKAINAELTKEIESLSSKADTGNSEAPLFELDGQLFGFHFHKAFFLGKAITHIDVLQDKDLQKALVEAGSGMIKAK